MTTEQLKAKYPQAIEMIDGVESPEKVYFIRGSRTVHRRNDGKYYYNYEGTHIREFKNLEHLIVWFFSTESEEEVEAEKELKEFVYNRLLSIIKGSEVWLDENNKIAEDYCDFVNDDFTTEELKAAIR